jgi:hypothetical protein
MELKRKDGPVKGTAANSMVWILNRFFLNLNRYFIKIERDTFTNMTNNA